MISLGLDIGSNSVGSACIDHLTGEIIVGLSIFPAGVDESDDKRGEPKNVKRRTARRARITLARRAERKRLLRLQLISAGLLPPNIDDFKKLLEDTDPWELRRKGLTHQLNAFEFGRVLLHLAQRRGALGFDAELGDKGKVKSAIIDVQKALVGRYGSETVRQTAAALGERIELLEKTKNRTDQQDSELEQAQEQLKKHCRDLLRDPAVTFGRFIADLRDQRRQEIRSEDKRKHPRGPREWRQPVRNKARNFEFHADRAMIRSEFTKLWDAQKQFNGPLARLLTDELLRSLDDESSDSRWRHKGLLFGQRKQSWDLGTLGRCVLEPTERCAPHADMYASRYLVVETVNNLKIIERGREKRALNPDERAKIERFLSGPLGLQTRGKQKGQARRSVTVSDLRDLMEWGHATKNSHFRFNIESDEEREINTDWFTREIICGAIAREIWEPMPVNPKERDDAFQRSLEKWTNLPEHAREGINRAILKCDPDDESHAARLKDLVMKDWAGLNPAQADALVAAWKKRPRPDAKRLNMSRRAVRNLLAIMEDAYVWADRKPDEPIRWRWLREQPFDPVQHRWPTQIEARKIVAASETLLDVTTGSPLNHHARRRYASGAKGATARDRHYMRKHVLTKHGEPIYGPDGNPLHEPLPAPLIGNPVVRKAIHEVRRHLVECMATLGCKPDRICIELAREAKMGKLEADRLLLRNRLRSRIRKDILAKMDLGGLSSTQQEEAVKRVVLCVQQGGECPLCGNQRIKTKITTRLAANGEGCELSHIIPKGSGGHNGLGNIVLAHTKCNRDMGRRTPRQFWEQVLNVPFEDGMSWVERIYANVEHLKFSEIKTAEGDSLWSCYFADRPGRRSLTFDQLKIEQFKKDVKDIQGMTAPQLAATQYAARQVMAYLADAVFDGNGLPERGGKRLIFATDGMWTGRLRREWGLSFDPHESRAKGLTLKQEHERKEKSRADHRHHAIDAVVAALCTQEVCSAWDDREKQAAESGVNTADEAVMANYRKHHPLAPPAPFKSREQLQEAVRHAVYGVGGLERPVCHRPVKRKLIGALHEETLFGPVVDRAGKLTEYFTAKKSVLALEPNHLRMPRPETEKEAIERLASRIQKEQNLDEKAARKRARAIVSAPGYTRKIVDPPPEKSGLVRDLALRKRLRQCLSEYRYIKKNRTGDATGETWLIDPGAFTENEIKQAFEAGAICHASGVPIRSVVLLRTMSDPVIVDRKRPDYATGNKHRDQDPASKRAYLGGNNHHIEIRVSKNKKGAEVWSAEVVTAYMAAQRNLAKLRAFRKAGVPKPRAYRKLSEIDRRKLRPVLGAIEKAHPMVDRSDNDEKGGRFVMSLCEGEMLLMKHKRTGEVGYFVVAKLDKPQSIVLVPHWDARAATERKDPEGNKVPDSKREQFAVTPTDLKELAPPGYSHAVKVRISPLGKSTILDKD